MSAILKDINIVLSLDYLIEFLRFPSIYRAIWGGQFLLYNNLNVYVLHRLNIYEDVKC
jgi:hypothetical protein